MGCYIDSFKQGLKQGLKIGLIFDLVIFIVLLLSITIFSISISAKLWICGKIYNIDDYASCICELFYNAVKDDDLDKVIKISYNVGEWGDYKGEEAREQFEDAMQQWVEENPYKAERIDDYFRKHRDVIPK